MVKTVSYRKDNNVGAAGESNDKPDVLSAELWLYGMWGRLNSESESNNGENSYRKNNVGAAGEANEKSDGKSINNEL